MTREEFLLDTIKYYSEDTSRRCVSEGRCTYSPKALNKNSKGCAIGRWLDKELQLKLDTFEESSVQSGKVFDKLPKWMQGMGIYFLQHVQDLHDNGNNWNESGLSQLGKDAVNKIIDCILNIPKYE